MCVFTRISAFACAVFAALLLTAAPAWAVYDQKIVLVGTGAEGMPADKVSFTTAAGQSVPVRVQADDDDDRSTFLLGFPGNASEGGRLTVGNQTYTVPAAGVGETLYVDLDTGRVGTRPPSRGVGDRWPGVSFTAGGAWGQIGIPEVGIGVTGIGANEAFAAKTESRIDMLTVGGSLGFDPGLWGMKLSISGYAGWGDDGQSMRVAPDGATSSGVVYGADVGTTGLSLGNVDLDTRVNSDIETHGIKVKSLWPGCGCWGDDWDFVPYTFLSYSGISQEHRLSVTSPAFPNQFSQVRHQDIDEDFFGFGVGGLFGEQISDRFRINLAGSIGGAYRDAELRSREDNTCTILGCGPLNNNIIIVEAEETDFTYTLGAGVGLEYYLLQTGDRRNAGLGIGANVNYIGDVAEVRNPLSGNDILNGATTTLDSEGSFSYNVGGYVRVSF